MTDADTTHAISIFVNERARAWRERMRAYVDHAGVFACFRHMPHVPFRRSLLSISFWMDGSLFGGIRTESGELTRLSYDSVNDPFVVPHSANFYEYNIAVYSKKIKLHTINDHQISLLYKIVTNNYVFHLTWKDFGQADTLSSRILIRHVNDSSIFLVELRNKIFSTRLTLGQKSCFVKR